MKNWQYRIFAVIVDVSVCNEEQILKKQEKLAKLGVKQDQNNAEQMMQIKKQG